MRLSLDKGDLLELSTQNLRKARLISKNTGNLNGAVIAAGYYAKRLTRTQYVYFGHTYTGFVWRVSATPCEFLESTYNLGGIVLAVTPDLTVSVFHILERQGGTS